MNVADFLRLVAMPDRTNYFVLAPDNLGLILLLQKTLQPIAHAEDVHFHDAEGITKEKAREIENEARMGSRAGSKLQHIFIYSLQKLPTDSAGPLLKAVEDAKFARFIFQAQTAPRKIHTLMSRSSVVKLPFLRKDVVLANLKKKNYDAKTADELGLYDGTLGGTIDALGMKDAIVSIRRDFTKGQRGISALFKPEILGSLAFETATENLFSEPEKVFLRGQPSFDRKKIVLYLAAARIP